MEPATHTEFSKLRHEAGLSRADAAVQLGLLIQEVEAYESGQSKPKICELQALKGLTTVRKPKTIQPAILQSDDQYTFYEFFAGGGMARLGLGANWKCLFANDIDEKKAETYCNRFGENTLIPKDIDNIISSELPGNADLAWGSFPCQDLSLAGSQAGLNAERSGTFWKFWRLIRELKACNRSPKLIVLENVYGALTSHDGKDFAAIADALAECDYKFGALVVNAIYFVPQSRPRLFIIAANKDIKIPASILNNNLDDLWHPKTLIQAKERLSRTTQANWLWWGLPAPPKRNTGLAEYIEDYPTGVSWHSAEQTQHLLSLMSPVNLAKVRTAQELKKTIVGTVYKRTRPDGKGGRVQRAEVRFDDVSGCLRTPSGGSSRQTIILVEGDSVRSRLLSPREAARLMGLPDDYELPNKYNEAYHLAGDGVVVQVVRYLAENILEQLLIFNANQEQPTDKKFALG